MPGCGGLRAATDRDETVHNETEEGTKALDIGEVDIQIETHGLEPVLEITQVHMHPEGDSFFPAIDPAVWREVAREAHPAGANDDAPYDFVSYLKVNTLHS